MFFFRGRGVNGSLLAVRFSGSLVVALFALHGCGSEEPSCCDCTCTDYPQPGSPVDIVCGTTRIESTDTLDCDAECEKQCPEGVQPCGGPVVSAEQCEPTVE